MPRAKTTAVEEPAPAANAPAATMDALTPHVRAKLRTMAEAAEATGFLSPVLEPHIPGVDLRYLVDGHKVAAIRVRLDPALGWRAEWPARSPGQRLGLYTEGFALPGEALTGRHFAGLDKWWARVPETGVQWRPSPDPWLSRAVRA